MFRFRLQAVETIRRNAEEEAQLKLGREQAILTKHLARLATLREERLQMLASLAAKERQKVQGSLVQFYMEAVRARQVVIKMQENTVAGQQQVVSRLRDALAEAIKRRKTVELLRNREYERYLAEARKKEQDEHDEMAVLRHGRAPQ